MGIISPNKLTENTRGIHDSFLDKLQARHEEERARIDSLLALDNLRRSIENLLDKQIQKTTKAALKTHLGALEAGGQLEPFLEVEIDIEQLATAAWNEGPTGLKKKYSAKDLAWAMSVLLEQAGYAVHSSGELAIVIPLTDDAAEHLLISQDETLDDDGEFDEELDEDLVIHDDDGDDEEEDSQEASEEASEEAGEEAQEE